MTEAEQNRLVIDNMGLVATIAADFRGGEVEFDDLLQAGREGLVKASKSFDPKLGKFSGWAGTSIRSEMWHITRSGASDWFPKEDALPPLDGDKIEKIYEWDSWGDFGNALGICETWSKLDATPEELAILYDELRSRRTKFDAAFISLTGAQRKLVKWVFLDDPVKPITEAARELGVSYFRAIRMLKKALATMREVIIRMETNSGGKTAKERPSTTSPHGCAPGTVAA